MSRPVLGPTQPPVQWAPESFSGGEADHSPPPSADVNAWSCTSTPPYVFMAWCFVVHMPTLLLPSFAMIRF